VTLEIPDNEVSRINQQVGNDRSNDPQCRIFEYTPETGVDRDPERCNYSHLPITKEIWKHLQCKGEVVNLDYNHSNATVVGSPGITVLFGGDHHGGGKFRFHSKPHFTSPEERKKK
jgi:hypothetical protein